MASRLTPIALVALLCAAAAVPSVGAAPAQGAACNLRGSWVASPAETRRYAQALNPTTSDIRVTSGTLSATFDRRLFTLGSIGLKLVGRKSARLKLKEELDIEATAPYTVSGNRLVLGPGAFKLTYVSVVIVLASGAEAPVNLPNASTPTPGSTAGYSCTPRTLTLQVPAGSRRVTLTMTRDHG